MENKNLRFIDLTGEEMIHLASFAKTTRHYGIDGSIYHYGTYSDGKVCIAKSAENVWEVYICERGNIYEKTIFSSCFDACIESLKYAAYTKAEEKKLINHYKKEVEDMKQSLKQIEEKDTIQQITNSLKQLKKSKK